jgi:hypothetical protein
MSADLLRRAAKVLREHAEKALPGPWDSLDNGDRFISDPGGEDDLRYIFAEPAVHGASANYCALMHPPVALAVAEVLEAHAESVEEDGPCFSMTSDVDAALTLARAILREPS